MCPLTRIIKRLNEIPTARTKARTHADTQGGATPLVVILSLVQRRRRRMKMKMKITSGGRNTYNRISALLPFVLTCYLCRYRTLLKNLNLREDKFIQKPGLLALPRT